jgi:hypothetical protein
MAQSIAVTRNGVPRSMFRFFQGARSPTSDIASQTRRIAAARDSIRFRWYLTVNRATAEVVVPGDGSGFEGSRGDAILGLSL